MVDHFASYEHEISPRRRASRPSSAESLHRFVPKGVSTCPTWVDAADKRALDLFHDRAADDSKEPRDIDLEDYP